MLIIMVFSFISSVGIERMVIYFLPYVQISANLVFRCPNPVIAHHSFPHIFPLPVSQSECHGRTLKWRARGLRENAALFSYLVPSVLKQSDCISEGFLSTLKFTIFGPGIRCIS